MNIIPNFFEKKGGRSQISHEELVAPEKLAFELKSKMNGLNPNRPIVFVCIGTDRSTGDSLGPFVGTLLKEKTVSPFFVYGTLEDPIHAINLKEKLEQIHTKHSNPFIIGVDACLGRMKSVGFIHIADGPVKPGAGVNKDLPEVGDIHITGIVNVSGFMEYFVLQNTRLSLVLNMAKTISDGIYVASTAYYRQERWSQLSWGQVGEERST